VAANNVVESNLVQDCGQVFHGAVGVWLGLTDGTRVRHNLIRRLPWTGVSSGTLFDATPSPCGNVLVESNHIHDVLQVLSDGGGIYTLGEQTGSVLRNNRIHGIPINAGLSESNGMFLDQGTTGLMITSNGLFDLVKSLLRFHIAGQNSVIGNTFRVYTPGQQPVRFQNSVPGNVTIADNVVIDPANPPACADPVCDAAIDAGLLPADAAVIFADADSDGVADLEDPCPVDAPDDSDGDAVCDSVDQCFGADDNIDGDGDGIPTACDQCPATPPGAQVVATGCCVASNCDLDLADYAVFSACLTGPGAGLRPQCAWTDFDGDGDTDLADFTELACACSQRS
jgi:hypothetical protein